MHKHSEDKTSIEASPARGSVLAPRQNLSLAGFSEALRANSPTLEELRHLRKMGSPEALLKELAASPMKDCCASEIERLRLKASVLTAITKLEPSIKAFDRSASREQCLARVSFFVAHVKSAFVPIVTKFFQDNTQDIARAINSIIGDLSINLSIRPTKNLTTPQLVEACNIALIKIKVFEQFGLAITDNFNLETMHFRRWSHYHLSAAQQALEKVPPAVLLWTPCLHTIRRSDSDPKFSSTYGTIALNGCIEICDLSYRNTKMLQRTLIHEVGHGIHFGSNFTLELDKSGKIISSGDPLYDFPAFADISGWRVVRKRFGMDFENNAVTVGKRIIPLTKPIHEADQIHSYTVDFFSPKGTLLWQYAPDSDFASSANAMTSPWEDWAEGWEQFIAAPDILKAIAPAKYSYFVRYFGED